MHIALIAEIPFVSFIPHTGNHFAAVQKAIFKYLWSRVRLVPNEKLKRIKLTIKRFVPFSYQILACENKYVSIRFYNALKIGQQIERIDRNQIPFRKVVI